MKARGLILASLLTLPGCGVFRNPPEQGITTGATIVYAGNGFDVFSVCDKGNLVYMTQKNPQVAVVPGGCNPGTGAVGPPPPAVVAALTERTPEPRTPPAFPQPFLVQLVPAPTAAAPLPAEPREPLVLQVQPSVVTVPACPVCPSPPPIIAKAAPPKVLVVPQLDPNTASADDLERLPGVTAKTAQAVLRGRPYHTLHELVDKRVLSEGELQVLAPYLRIR